MTERLRALVEKLAGPVDPLALFLGLLMAMYFTMFVSLFLFDETDFDDDDKGGPWLQK